MTKNECIRCKDTYTLRQMIKWANKSEIQNLWYFWRDEPEMVTFMNKVIRLNKLYEKEHSKKVK